MIKKFVVSVFCVLVIISGFSFGVLAEQNERSVLSETRLFDTEIMSSEVVSHTDVDTISSSYFLDALDQQQTIDSGYFWAVSENGYYAQSFKPTLGYLTRVEVKAYKIGNPVGLTISIRSNLTSVDLTSKYVSGSSIPTNPTNRTWVEFDFPDIAVTLGSTYYIVWDPVGVPDFKNNSYWTVGIDNPYANGFAWIYLGSVWQIHNPIQSPDPDFCFKTYGLSGGNNPPNTPSKPTGPTSGIKGTSYTYSTSTTDLDGDKIRYGWDWNGDGTTDEWTSLYASGVKINTSHIFTNTGIYNIKVMAEDEHGAQSTFSETLPVTISSNPPNKPSKPSGSSSGKPGVSYTYETSTTDPDGDQLYYMWDWADGTPLTWDGPYNSGQTATASHIWSAKGAYSVKVKAKDATGAESVWSDPLPITMPYSFNSPLLQLLEWIFQRFPNTFPLLRQLMGY